MEQEWEVVPTKGVQVRGGYGHSSVYDEERKRIYVHGGYKLKAITQHILSDDLLVYNPANQHW